MLTYPPVDVQQVDIIGLQLRQRISNREMQALPVVPRVVDGLAFAEFPTSIWGREPGSQMSSVSRRSRTENGEGKLTLTQALKCFDLRFVRNINVLGSNDHQVTILLGLDPFTEPLLRLFVLIVVLDGQIRMLAFGGLRTT